MKSERRHELEHNALAYWLGGLVKRVAPYQNALFLALAAVLLGLIAYSWWGRYATANAAESWNALYAALDGGSTSQVEDVIEDHPNSEAAPWAAAVAGDLRLAHGCNLLFVNKHTGQQELRKAIQHYQAILESAGQPELRERAVFGLGRAYEAMGDLSKASEQYQRVAQDWPDGAFATIASRRVEDLKRAETRRWYDQRWAKFDPKPAYAAGPAKQPSFDLNTLPDEPVFTPKFDLTEKAAEEGAKEAGNKAPGNRDVQNEAGKTDAGAKEPDQAK